MSKETFLSNEGRNRVFTAVKYVVYLLLCYNVFLFLEEELLALEHTFVDGFEPGELIQVFSATIDTAAWVILLILFELETSVLDDKYIKGPVKLSLHGIRGLCYLAIVYAFTGYYAELLMLYQVSGLELSQACDLVDQGYSLLRDLDEYAPLDIGYCHGVGSEI